jgi:hypothetical protein
MLELLGVVLALLLVSPVHRKQCYRVVSLLVPSPSSLKDSTKDKRLWLTLSRLDNKPEVPNMIYRCSRWLSQSMMKSKELSLLSATP